MSLFYVVRWQLTLAPATLHIVSFFILLAESESVWLGLFISTFSDRTVNNSFFLSVAQLAESGSKNIPYDGRNRHPHIYRK